MAFVRHCILSGFLELKTESFWFEELGPRNWPRVTTLKMKIMDGPGGILGTASRISV